MYIIKTDKKGGDDNNNCFRLYREREFSIRDLCRGINVNFWKGGKDV